jgi:hypothetical protein
MLGLAYCSAMRTLFYGLVVTVIFVGHSSAASLTLGCSGTLTTSQMSKDPAVPTPDPEKESVSDFSVVVDFDKHAVTGFWAETNGIHTLVPIIAADANSVTFSAQRTIFNSKESIQGSVDRITGYVTAMDSTLWPTGGVQIQNWDLHCRPTRPLF